MSNHPVDPERFFECFSGFVETSQTGSVVDRLNARYLALIHANRELINGSSVLDLASHDGLFSFAALKNGARRVIGIEAEPDLVKKSLAHMERYNIPRNHYEFVCGDVFDDIETVEPCDIVLCFGLLYHVNNHMLLLSRIAESDPRGMIVDTNISQLESAVIEVRNPLGGSPPRLGGQLEGYPTKAALDAMFSSFGWTHRYVDWTQSGLLDRPQMDDYRTGQRVSAIIDCNRQSLSAKQRDDAVQSVFEQQRDRRSQWLVITRVAAEVGTTPQALCVWVRKAERAMRRRRTPASQ
jgi:hypothetical protein